MGYALLMATCASCGRPMTCNPALVPSVRIGGSREPVCRACVERANPVRVQNGLDPIEILPGAYEACDERDL